MNDHSQPSGKSALDPNKLGPVVAPPLPASTVPFEAKTETLLSEATTTWVSPLEVHYHVTSSELEELDKAERIPIAPPELRASQILLQLESRQRQQQGMHSTVMESEPVAIPHQFSIAEMMAGIGIFAVGLSFARLLNESLPYIFFSATTFTGMILTVWSHQKQPTELKLLLSKIFGFLFFTMVLIGLVNR